MALLNAETRLPSMLRRQVLKFPVSDGEGESPKRSRNATMLNIQQGSGFERPSTPNSGNSSPANEPPEFVSQPQDMSKDDDEDNSHRSSGNLLRKKGGYDSRLEQLLCEDQDLQIIIVDAGKSQESGGSYISYTIRTGVGSIRS